MHSMVSLDNPLALHTWTLDTTPLAEVLRIARSTGWDAVELRRIDFERRRQQQHERLGPRDEAGFEDRRRSAD